jgi:predicted XRE-type DNA-binding protein
VCHQTDTSTLKRSASGSAIQENQPMPRPRTSKRVTVRTAKDLGQALGLSAADTAEMAFRSELTVVLAKIIQAGRLTHAAIAKSAGISRTRVTAIANGNTHGVSTDVLIRVLAATGHRAEVRVKKAAA